MGTVSGLLTISTAAANDLVGEFQESVLVRNAKGIGSGATLFGLMARLKNEEAENTEFNWFERDPVRRTLFVNNGGGYGTSAADNATTLILSETTGGVGNAWPYLEAGHLLHLPATGEYVKVAAQPSGNTVSVIRNFNGTATAAAIANNAQVVILTLGKSEGANAIRASYEEPSLLTNYIQTFNSTVELSNAFKANKLRSDLSGPLKDRRIQALDKISRDIELAFLLGRRARNAGSTGYEYFTGGLSDSLTRAGLSGINDVDAGGAITWANFRTWMESFMVYGSDTKLALCGPTAYSVISNYANSATNGFRIMNQETVFGMNITVINTPFGELDLAFHPLLKEVPAYASYMYVVDLPLLVQKVQEPLFLERNIQTPGQDAYKEQYRAKLGLKLKFANAFGILRNVTSIS